MSLGLVNILVGPITKLLDKIIPDKDERDRLAFEIATLTERHAHEASMAQLEVNKTEAQHGSIFVAGARPAIMWICGAGIAWNFVIKPIVMWFGFLYGVDLDGAPELDTSELTTILLGMLGLGGLRTYEKSVGVARNEIITKSKREKQ